jgi:hypothetical protein
MNTWSDRLETSEHLECHIGFAERRRQHPSRRTAGSRVLMPLGDGPQQRLHVHRPVGVAPETCGQQRRQHECRPFGVLRDHLREDVERLFDLPCELQCSSVLVQIEAIARRTIGLREPLLGDPEVALRPLLGLQRVAPVDHSDLFETQLVGKHAVGPHHDLVDAVAPVHVPGEDPPLDHSGEDHARHLVVHALHGQRHHHVGRRTAEQFAQLGDLLGRGLHRVVGVDDEAPVAAHHGPRLVAGPAEVVVPVAEANCGTHGPGQFDGVVGRAGVVHHHLIGHQLGSGDSTLDPSCLVLHDHRRADERHVAVVAPHGRHHIGALAQIAHVHGPGPDAARIGQCKHCRQRERRIDGVLARPTGDRRGMGLELVGIGGAAWWVETAHGPDADVRRRHRHVAAGQHCACECRHTGG